MSDIDLDRLPSGVRGWNAFVQWAAAGDDRLERYFLELKSDVDLNTRHGQHKVAKFILAAANRDPARAARRLGGYAVMLLGVGAGRITGISGFEAKDLEREIRKLAGAEGPGWDYEQIPVDAERDVIAVVVDPPTGEVWPSHADGDGVKNGDVYLRGDGDTRKATGAEIAAMLKRPTPTSGLPPIGVRLEGEALALALDDDALRAWVQDTADDYFDEMHASSSRARYGLGVTMERRTAEAFDREVEQWRERSLAAPSTGVHEIAGRFGAGVRLGVINPSRQPLREVRVDVYVDDATAVPWEERRDGEDIEIFPDRPLAWGKDSMLFGGTYTPRYVPSRPADRTMEIVRAKPAHLAFTIDLLRPLEEVVSEDVDAVLFIPVSGERSTSLPVRWTLSSGDIPDLLEGEANLSVQFMDLTYLGAVSEGDD
ncbi:hypothetical protein Q9R20_06285 [Microbacterium sp. PRF11]|uniref:hypothetical protein n=1 Tax=Microbacterium sp. PRF11 TaxID=2962593 RepID=UPI0028823F23|nr:hypothetical protein [Microbacterium sp. PRF11]MDT0116595.1 hypothetical protein [Microbacterium sp. PRF11]